MCLKPKGFLFFSVCQHLLGMSRLQVFVYGLKLVQVVSRVTRTHTPQRLDKPEEVNQGCRQHSVDPISLIDSENTLTNPAHGAKKGAGRVLMAFLHSAISISSYKATKSCSFS